jgi:hypothetical protein
MNHPSDIDDNEVLTAHGPSEPPAEQPTPAPQTALPEKPFDDDITAQVPGPRPEVLERNIERQAAASFQIAAGQADQFRQTVSSNVDTVRVAASGNAEKVADVYAGSTEAYDAASQAMRASAEQFASAMAELNMKLFEFGRRNAESSLDFVRSVSGARNMRDLVDAQTAYLRGQYDALAGQLRELQTLTTELAGKTAEPLKQQITRAAQLPRIR